MNLIFTTWFPSRKNIALLLVMCTAYAAVSLLAQIEFPAWGNSEFSPLELALWLAIFTGVMGTVVKLSASDPSGSQRRYWTLATIAIVSISVLESADWFADTRHIWQSSGYESLSNFLKAALAIIIAAALFWSTRLPREYVWGVRFLLATVVFQFLSILFETTQSGHILGFSYSVPEFTFSTEFAELLCIELYIVSLALSGIGKAISNPFANRPTSSNGGLFVGANARQVYLDFNLYRGPKHPPVALSFYPVFQEITVFLVMVWLASTAGVAIKRAKNKSILLQLREMTVLWFRCGIDPPSYYAQELYEVARQHEAPNYLTRYETKNGLLSTLNNRMPKPFKVNEMSHKVLFSACCAKYSIPHPQQLLTVDGDKIDWNCMPSAMETDLFCKRQRGMGATGTRAFRYKAPNHYVGEDGEEHDLEGVLRILKQAAANTPMLVQPWLRNHPSIADLALDSLITIRVVTCGNERGEPEVTLAMLRLLAKLEPKWKSLPDEEYAAPINIVSGEMGLFTGDNFRTSHLRYETHPITGAQINGRVLPEWQAIMNLSIAAHKAFPHRLLIGWDIALTENGPVVLEGNSNLDVMFLQRVHDAPAGRSRLGELMNFHLKDFYRERMRLKDV